MSNTRAGSSIFVDGHHLFSRGGAEPGYSLDVTDNGMVLRGPAGEEVLFISAKEMRVHGQRVIFEGPSMLDSLLSDGAEWTAKLPRTVRYSSGRELLDQLKEHGGCRRAYLPGDDPRRLMLGFVCSGCGLCMETHLDDFMVGLDDFEVKSMQTAEGRLALIQSLVRT